MEKMWKTKGGVYAALLMLVLILFINANPSRATSLALKMSNNSAGGSDCSSIHDCLIADDQSLEFLLGPEMVTTESVTPGSVNGGKPIVDCGRDKSYKSCLPGPQNTNGGEHCFDTYGRPTHNRGC